MKTLNATKCPDCCRSDNSEGVVFDACTTDAADSVVPEALCTSLDNLDGITLFDSAVHTTIATMPNALRLLENS